MLKTLCLSLLLLLQPSYTQALRTGELLRFHVVAQDNSAAMQAIKAPVRDAMQRLYCQEHDAALSMLDNARMLLPSLAQAAQEAALEQGFAGKVIVSLERSHFGFRVLDGCVIPPGEYPALMVRLGEAKGRNWWGLLDPESSLRAACCEDTGTDVIEWDWSLRAILEALLGFCPAWIGG